MRLLRPDEAAAMLRISKRQVYVLASQGAFTSCKIGNLLRIEEGSIMRYVNKQFELYSLETGYTLQNTQTA